MKKITSIPAKPQLSRFKKILTIGVLSLALAIIIIDTTLLNVSLGTIIREFNTDIQSIQWVITAYSLILAAFTITGGRFGDLFGRRKMFVVGAITFAVGSFIASISTNVPTMIAGESIIEGIGAALMMPATASLLLSNFKGRERALAFGIWGGVAGAASAVGPILGGYLTTNYSWRWGFRINVVIAAILCIGSLFLPETRDTKEKPTIDWMGVLLSSLGLFFLVFGFIESSRYGWFVATEQFSFMGNTLEVFKDVSVTPISIVIGLVILAWFFMWEKGVEKQGRTPLVSPSLFANRQFTAGGLTTMVLTLGQSGLIFSLPVFFQSVRGYDAFQTGLSLLPMSLTLLIVSPLAAFFSSKIQPKWLIQGGLFINTIAMIVLRNALGPDSTTLDLLPGLVLLGVGMGMVFSQINNITLSAVSVDQAGEASGVNNTLRQVGASLGSAIIGAVLISSLSSNLSTGIDKSTVIPERMKPMIATAVAKQTSNVEFGGGAQLGTQIPTSIANEIKAISHRSTVEASKQSLLMGVIFAVLGFLISFSIPNIKIASHGEKPLSGH